MSNISLCITVASAYMPATAEDAARELAALESQLAALKKYHLIREGGEPLEVMVVENSDGVINVWVAK